MRAPTADLPIRFENVTVSAGAVTILDHITLTLISGPPTVVVGTAPERPHCCVPRWDW